MKYSRELGPTGFCRSTVGVAALMRRVVGLVVLCFLGLNSHTAMADCGFASGYGLNTSQVTLPASITVKRDAVVGTVLFDSGWNNGGATDIWCSGSGPFTAGYASAMTLVPGLNHVYATGVAGIGIKTAFSNSYPSQPSNIDAAFLLDWPRTSSSYGPVEYTPAGLYRVQLVVTGPIPVGTNSLTLPSPSAYTQYGSLITNRVTFTNPLITVNSVGCTVGNNNIGVPMDAIQTSALSGVGTTSTYKKDFSIDLMCPDSSTAVSYQIDDMGSSGLPANTGVLANGASAPRAAGVGVQVLKSDGVTVVPLSTRISYVTTSANNQSVSIPMFARYYQTAAAVTGGYVVANATFTMFYQ